MQDLEAILKRESQLNLLTYVVITVLIAVAGLLALMLIGGLRADDLWLLRNQFAQILLIALLLAVVVYLADTRRRLRRQLRATHKALMVAKDELTIAYDRIVFAHRVAATAVSLSEKDAIRRSLRESARRFRAEAAVVVMGDDLEVFAEDEALADEAYSIAMEAALKAVNSGTLESFSLCHDGHEIIATPLRIRGNLHAVACLMRRQQPFAEEDAEGFELVARVLELGIENRALMDDMRAQLTGVLKILSTLVEERQPRYTAHCAEVASSAVEVGKMLRMTQAQLEELKLAAVLHDVGMLLIPRELIDAPRQLTDEERAEVQRHPANGADLVRHANFTREVQEAIRSHHERVDGGGYPSGRKGREIPLSARIIAVCDAFDAMTHDRPYRGKLSKTEAVEELKLGCGTAYDPKVVGAFMDVLAQRAAPSIILGA